MQVLDDLEKDLLKDIETYTSDVKSRGFWVKSIKHLGHDIVAACLFDVKDQERKGNVKTSKARLLTYYIRQEIEKMGKIAANPEIAVHQNTKNISQNKNIKPYYATQLELFEVFANIKVIDVENDVLTEDIKLADGREYRTFPYASMIEPTFFTLSTNKAKSDKVKAIFRTGEKNIEVNLHRGQNFAGDTERGIPTAEHGRILGALGRIWEKQGQPCYSAEGKSTSCFCLVNVRELAKELGLSSFGGKDLKRLKRKLADLAAFPYYYDLSTVDKKIKSVSFTLLKRVVFCEMKDNNSYTRVEFSELYSQMLLERKLHRRELGINKIQSELGWLIRILIEPVLMAFGVFHKELQELIKDLYLPAAKWHGYPSQRKNVVEKAIKELQGATLSNGRTLEIGIRKGKKDYVLEAKTGNKKLLIDSMEK